MKNGGTWEDLFEQFWLYYVKARIPAQAFDKMNENFFRTTFASRTWDALPMFYTIEMEYNTPAGRCDFLATPKPGLAKGACLIEFKYFAGEKAKRLFEAPRVGWIVEVMLSLDVMARGLANQERIAEELQIFGDGDAVGWYFGDGRDGMGQFGWICKASHIAHCDIFVYRRLPCSTGVRKSQQPTERKKGCRIDLLLQTEGSVCIVEIKRMKELGVSIEAEIREKASRLAVERGISVTDLLRQSGEICYAIRREINQHFHF